MKRRILIVLGTLCILSIAAFDPTVVALLVDVEFVTLLGTVAVALVRGDAREMWHQLRQRPSVVTLRAGWAVTREKPVSLLGA